MEHIGRILKTKYNKNNNVNNNVNNYITDNNVNNISKDTNVNSSKKDKYALNRQNFTPNTEKSQIAEEIANFLNDLKNYACFLDVVNKIGVDEAYRLLQVVKSDIEEKAQTKTPVRNPARYFMWKYKKKLY